MNDYIINENTLCFAQDMDNDDTLLVIEKTKKINIKMKCLKFINKCCCCYGYSYNMQRQFVIDKFNFYIKTPIIVSEYNMFIFFPTASPHSKDCIWISYNNVERYVKEKDYTKVYFEGGKVLNINAKYTTIDNQITKCIKIERYLNNLKMKR